jgi:uncharacterized protein (DUF433 family)
MAKLSLFGDKDPREVPLYGVAQAASYFKVPPSTLRAWIVGQPYLESQGRHGIFDAVITPAATNPTRLSFNNLAELHVLATLRRGHSLGLSVIRNAMRNLRGAHPLIEHELETDGHRIYVGATPIIEISTGEGRQTAMRDIIKEGLRHVERDKGGKVARLFPDPDRRVVIDPRIAFGKPTVVGTGVTVAVLADFVKAGESAKRVAREFKLVEGDVKAAVDWFVREAA